MVRLLRNLLIYSLTLINLHRRSKLLRLSDRLRTLVKIEWGPNPRIFGTKFDERRDCTLRRMSLNFLKLECKQTHYRKVKGEDSSLFKSHGACIVHPLSFLKCSTCRRTSRSSMLAARKVWKVIKSTSTNIALALEEFKYRRNMNIPRQLSWSFYLLGMLSSG